MAGERYSGSAPAIQPIRSNAPQLFQSLAARLSAFSTEQENELDRQMAKKAKEQGLIDAQGKTQITLRDGSTIADEAWNEGAIASHVAAVKLDMTDNLTRIAVESERNPEAYTAKARAYSEGLLSGIPEQVQPAVRNELAGIMLSATQSITADVRTFEREQHAAQTTTAIDLYRTSAENKAKLGDMVGATEDQLAAIRLTDSMEASGMIDPGVAEKQRNDITRDTEDQAIYGEFARQMNNGAAVAFLNQFKSLKSLGDRDPDYRKKMEAEMLGMVKKAHALEDDVRKQEEDARKELWRKTETELVTMDLRGELTIEWIQEKVADGSLDPKIAAKYKKNALLEGPEFSRSGIVNAYRANLLGYSEIDIRTDSDLSRPDRDKLIDERRSLESDAGNWRSTQHGREGARRINFQFGILPGADTSRLSPEKALRADRLLTQYFNEVEALPVEEREVKALDIADNLVQKEGKRDTIDALDNARKKLGVVQVGSDVRRFYSIEEIQGSDLPDHAKDLAIKKYQRKEREIKALEAQLNEQ